MPRRRGPATLLCIEGVEIKKRVGSIDASAPTRYFQWGLGLDPARIGIKGESGGGGFAAAAALYARDRQGPKFAFQHLIYPMIDDRTAVRKDLHPYVGEFIWTQENNYFGWRSLLGEEPGSADVSPYAAAARAADLSGLPPTYISVVALISSSKKT